MYETFVVLHLVTVRTPVGLSRTAKDKPLISCKVAERTLNRKLTYLEPLQCPRETCTPPSSSSSPSSFNGGTRDKRHPITRIFAMLSSTSIQRSSTHANSYIIRDVQQVNMRDDSREEIPSSTQNGTCRTTTIKSSTRALYPRTGSRRPGAPITQHLGQVLVRFGERGRFTRRRTILS